MLITIDLFFIYFVWSRIKTLSDLSCESQLGDERDVKRGDRRLLVAEIRMLILMCGVPRMYKISSECIRGNMKIAPVTEKSRT